MRINLFAAMTRIVEQTDKHTTTLNASDIELEKYIIDSMRKCLIANNNIGLGMNTSMAVY